MKCLEKLFATIRYFYYKSARCFIFLKNIYNYILMAKVKLNIEKKNSYFNLFLCLVKFRKQRILLNQPTYVCGIFMYKLGHAHTNSEKT